MICVRDITNKKKSIVWLRSKLAPLFPVHFHLSTKFSLSSKIGIVEKGAFWCCYWILNQYPMSLRRRTLLKVIVLGDSGYSHAHTISFPCAIWFIVFELRVKYWNFGIDVCDVVDFFIFLFFNFSGLVKRRWWTSILYFSLSFIWIVFLLQFF